MKPTTVKPILFALCVGEVATLFATMCLYYAASYVDTFSFLRSRPGILFLCSSFVLILSIILVIRTIRSGHLDSRRLALACAMNILMLILIIGSIESGIRVLTKRTLTGETFRGALLQPRKWSEVKAHYQGVLERMAQGNSFLIYDPILGWTPASSSRNTTGENISSAEGLRSPRIGMTFTDRHTRHSGFSENPATIRIALLGDSMTYGNEVLCEDSWGHALEANLGADVQILNFGVSAYGLNQVLHRYERDVRPWKPQIVIIGITSLEIQRLVWIYKFLNPHWGGDPFVYPRLVFRDGTFSHINQPPTTPKEISSYSSIKDLPYIHLDANYRSLEWERDGLWHLLQKSYFFRFLISISPPREPVQEGVSDKDMLAISQHVLKTMVEQVRKDGATPLIVHLPYQFELQNVAKHTKNYIPLSVQTLHDSRIDYFDVASCLLEAKATDEYMQGGHYSPKANAVIAKCLEPILREKLSHPNH